MMSTNFQFIPMTIFFGQPLHQMHFHQWDFESDLYCDIFLDFSSQYLLHDLLVQKKELGSEQLFFVMLSGFWIWSQQSSICRLRLVVHCFLDLIDGTSSCGAWTSGFPLKMVIIIIDANHLILIFVKLVIIIWLTHHIFEGRIFFTSYHISNVITW